MLIKFQLNEELSSKLKVSLWLYKEVDVLENEIPKPWVRK